MKGGVIPGSFEEVQLLITEVANATRGRFPIPSQHEGNCASDSIQIILSFADRIGPAFAVFALDMYEHRRTILQDTLPAPRSGMTDEGFGKVYLEYAVQRYLAMLDGYRQLVRIEAGPIALRTASNLPPAEDISRGVLCSTVFAVKAKKIQSGDEARGMRGRHGLYPYSARVYDPIVQYVLTRLNPDFRLVTTTGNPRTDLAGVPHDHLVGIQMFCRSQQGYFHTFTLFRMDKIWFIGDNEVGSAILTNLTTPELTEGTMSFTVNRAVTPMGDIFRRTYTFGRKRFVADYAIHSGGLEYTNATEESATREFGMRRKYFLAPPNAYADGLVPRPPVVPPPLARAAPPPVKYAAAPPLAPVAAPAAAPPPAPAAPAAPAARAAPAGPAARAAAAPANGYDEGGLMDTAQMILENPTIFSVEDIASVRGDLSKGKGTIYSLEKINSVVSRLMALEYEKTRRAGKRHSTSRLPSLPKRKGPSSASRKGRTRRRPRSRS